MSTESMAKTKPSTSIMSMVGRVEAWIADMAPLPARVFIAAIFIWSGTHKIFGWEGTAGYMESRGMFLVEFFLLGAIILELGGGLSVLTGLKTRLGAIALIVFLVPTTFIFHSWWTYPPEEQRMQMINFMKNFAVIGGLMYVLSFGGGRFSLDRLIGKRKT